MARGQCTEFSPGLTGGEEVSEPLKGDHGWAGLGAGRGTVGDLL